jgi:hypothetical protein
LLRMRGAAKPRCAWWCVHCMSAAVFNCVVVLVNACLCLRGSAFACLQSGFRALLLLRHGRSLAHPLCARFRTRIVRLF